VFTKNNKRISLRSYWTSRYLVTLFLGLTVIAIISALWIRHNTLENRLNMMELMADNLSNRIVATNEHQPPPDFFQEKNAKLDIYPIMYIVDTSGDIVSRNRPGPLMKQFDSSILEAEEPYLKITLMNERFYLVKSPIEIDNSIVGWVVLMDSKEHLTHVEQEYTQLAIMIISLALLGWAAIYVLSSRLSKPIKDVAEAAKLVSEGNYQIDIPNNGKEKEVFELIQSFKEMTHKLEKLESLRTELLAGVTHELKTPVTAISGLLQAVRDEVVTGEEAKEFLNISLNEVEKMKKMVEDLLAFNQFATNAVMVLHKDYYDINEVVEDAVFTWQIAQQDEGIEIEINQISTPTEVLVDPLRFQQIITNLLNNAKSAMDNQGEIRITIMEENQQIAIDVVDTGGGIPEEEQPYIFERFFRGENKKLKVRGLGLGLTLSKMIANALDGDLVLLKSSEEGTTFRITLLKK